MYIPGIICIVGGLVLMERLRDVPRTLGLPTVEAFKEGQKTGVYQEKDSAGQPVHDSQYLTAKRILFDHVLKNKYIWLLAVSYFFVYMIRMGVSDWGALYLYETKGYTSIFSASVAIAAFEVGGFISNVMTGWLSDKFFKGRRVPVMILYSLLLILAMMAFFYVPAGHGMMDSLLMGLIGFLIFGPQMLNGVAAVEFSHKKAAGTATGFTGCFAYIGAAASGFLGMVCESYGWHGFFFVLVLCCIITCALLTPIVGSRTWLQKINEQEEKSAREGKLQKSLKAAKVKV